MFHEQSVTPLFKVLRFSHFEEAPHFHLSIVEMSFCVNVPHFLTFKI